MFYRAQTSFESRGHPGMPLCLGRPTLRRSTGFTLIEVLVAVVVITIGLLGMTSLQSYGLAENNRSLMRLKASYKAYEMADRMRANQRAFDSTITGYRTSVSNCNTGSFVTDCTTSGCTPQQIAQNDLCEWQTDLQVQLPGGSGTVCVDSTPDDGTALSPQCDGSGQTINGVPAIYVIKVWWNDDRTGTLKRFTTTVRP